jgi:hypothetical protein
MQVRFLLSRLALRGAERVHCPVVPLPEPPGFVILFDSHCRKHHPISKGAKEWARRKPEKGEGNWAAKNEECAPKSGTARISCQFLVVRFEFSVHTKN